MPAELNHEAVVYSRNGPIHCRILSRKCLQGTCKLLPTREIATQGIFFVSNNTGAGDEIGWDFLSRVQTSKISFTGFCNEVTRVYQTTNIFVAKFMSPTTFISWIFAWMSAFKVDFREEIDPWCKHNPAMLACDGTHIGVSVRLANLENPVTAVDWPEEVRILVHKRYICPI